MRKILSTLIVLFLVLSLSSCVPRSSRRQATSGNQSQTPINTAQNTATAETNTSPEVFTTEPSTPESSSPAISKKSFNSEADIFSLIGKNINAVDVSSAISVQETTPGKVYTFADVGNELSWSISTCQGIIYQLGLYNISTNQNLMIKNNLIMSLSEVAMLQSFGSPKSHDSSFVENATDGSKNFNRLLYEFDFSNDSVKGYTGLFLTYKDIERNRPWGVSFQNLDVCENVE